MTTYSTLQADVALWSARTGLTAEIPSFIRLAEAEIGRTVRTMEMETDIVLNVAGTANSVALPTGFLGFRHVFVRNARQPKAVYLSPDQFHEVNNRPKDGFRELLDGALNYTVEANLMRVDKPRGADDPIELDTTYFKQFDALSDTNTTHTLIQKHYDLYLWATLAQLWAFVMDAEEEQKSLTRYENIVDQIEGAEIKRRRSGGPKRVRPPEVVV